LALVEQACLAVNPGMPAGQITTAKAKLGKQVMEAAAEARAMFQKHIVPAMATLEYRLRFDVRAEPAARPEADAVYDHDRTFFGCLPEQYGPAINAEWASWVEEWWSKSAVDPAGAEAPHPKFYWASVNSYQHWLGKAEWPHLQKVALWWGEVQLSSIDAERAIALGRVIAVPNRGGQSWGAFKRELAFRMHADDLDALLIQNMQRM